MPYSILNYLKICMLKIKTKLTIEEVRAYRHIVHKNLRNAVFTYYLSAFAFTAVQKKKRRTVLFLAWKATIEPFNLKNF